MDWSRFAFDWQPLDRRTLFELLIEIEAHRQSASHLLLPTEWREQLDRLNRIRAVHGTTAIEGNPLTEAEVGGTLDLLDAQPTAGSVPHEQVRNAGRAQVWVKARFASEGSGPLRVEDLLHLHELLTAGSDERDNTPGGCGHTGSWWGPRRSAASTAARHRRKSSACWRSSSVS